MAARVVDAGFALIYLRLLLRTDVGAYQFLVVLTTYLDTLVDFGLNALLAREVARGTVGASSAFRAVNALRLALWLVGLPVVVLVYGPLRSLVNLPEAAAVAGWVFYLALLPSILAKTASGLLWASERLDLTASVSVVATLLRTLLGAIVLFAGFGLVGLAASSLVTNIVTALVLWRFAAHAVIALDRSTGHQLHPRAWLAQSWPLFVNQLLQGLFFKIDSLLLLPLAGAASAGAYAAAYKVAEGGGMVSSSFTLALFPRLSRESDLSQAYEMALRVLLQLALPLVAGVALLAEPVVGLVGGRDYLPDAAIALTILIFYLPFSYANGLTQYVLIAAGRQRLLTGAFVAALFFNLVANLLLIPRFGYLGAAFVTVVSELVLLVPFQRGVRQVTHGVSLRATVRGPLLATVLMAPVVWWVRDAVHPLAAVAAGAMVYSLALWAVGGVSEREVRLLQHVLAR